MSMGGANILEAQERIRKAEERILEAEELVESASQKCWEANKAYVAACDQASVNNCIPPDDNVRNAVNNLWAARDRLDFALAVKSLEEASCAYDVACHTGDGLEEAVFQVHEAGRRFQKDKEKETH